MAEAGSVWVSVIPSMKGFTTKVKSELRGLDVSIGLNVDTKAAKAKIAEATKDTTVDVDADTRKAESKIAAFHKRAQTIRDIRATLDLNVTGAIGNLARVNASLLAVPAVAGAAAYSVGSIGAALAPAVGIAALLPAAVGAGAVAVAALKIGVSGFGDAVKLAFDPTKAAEFAEAIAKMPAPMRNTVLAVQGLKPQIDGLRLGVQSALFANMAGEVSRLGGIYLPMLTGTLSSVAGGFNRAALGMTAWLGSSVGIGHMRTLLDFSAIAVNNISAALAPLGAAFITIGAIGAPILAELTAGAGGVAGRFASWVGSAEGINTIRGWIYGAIGVLQQLGAIVGNVGSILGSLFSAAQMSGANFLGTLQSITGEVARFFSSAQGQTALVTLFTNIRMAVDAALPGLRAILDAFGYLITSLAPILPLVGQAFSAVVIAARPLLDILVGLVTAVLPPLLGLITQYPGVFIGLAIALGIVSAAFQGLVAVGKLYAAFQLAMGVPAIASMVTATWAWVAGLWAQAAALLAAYWPVLLVIAGIAALVAGVIYAYQNFEWFRTAIDAVGAAFVWLWQSAIVPAWNAITTAISWAWNTIIWPVLQAIGTALAFLGTIIGVVLVAPFVIAWNIISAAAQGAWALLSMIWTGLMVPALQFLGSIFTWLWQNVVTPVWNGIVTVVSLAWAGIRIIFDLLMAGLRFVGSIFTWLWVNVVVPVWNGISSAIGAAWNWIKGNVFDPIVNFLRGVLGPVFEWLYRNIIVPVWDGISRAISGAWNFIQGVFNTGKAAVQAVGQAFQNVADWVGRAWAAIREHARGPVQFVVDVVYNNGIMPVWNGIAGLFGMPKLGPVRFAEGGVLPGYTPGRDIYNARLSGGEGILVPEAVRGLGAGFVGWANSTFSGGRSKGGQGTPQGGPARFADGGVFGFLGDAANWVGGKFADMGAFLMSAMGNPVEAVKGLFSGVTGDAARTPGSGGWTDALKALPGKAIEGVIKKVKEWVANLAAGGMGPLGAGAPFYVREITRSALGRGMGGHGAMIGVATAIVESALKMYANRRVPASLAFPHDAIGSDHDSVGLFQQRQAGWGTIAQRMNAFGSAELFFSRLGRFNWRGMEPGAAAQRVQVSAFPGRYSGQMGRARSLVGQYTGVTFDRGGLAAGRGLMMKDVIRPERTLSPRQTVAFERLVPLLSSMARRSPAVGPGAYAGMASSSSVPTIGAVYQQLPEGASGRRFAEELSFEMRKTGAGVHSR